MKKCVNCGKEIDSENVYCPHCGKRADKKSVSPVLLLVLVLPLIACLIFWAVSGTGSDESDYHLTVRSEKVKVRADHNSEAEHVGYIYKDEVIDAYEMVKVSGEQWYKIGENAWVVDEDKAFKVAKSEVCYDHSYVPMVKIGSMNVGSSLKLGSFAGEDVEWLVAENTGKELLLVSKFAIDYRPFDTEFKTWGESYIREWLNGDFLNESFDKAEIQAIINVVNNTERNDEESTIDRVFLLSESEAGMYLRNDNLRICAPTKLALNNGANNAEHCPYYLRTLNGEDKTVLMIRGDGTIAYNTKPVDDASGIRPAMWVRIAD